MRPYFTINSLIAINGIKTSINNILRPSVPYLTLCIALLLLLLLLSLPSKASDFVALPSKVSNNAVAQVTVNDQHYLISFSGLGKNKTYKDAHNYTYIFDVTNNSWSQGKSVPIAKPVNGLVGRLASVATAIKHKAYVFGGYTVAVDHSEVSVPDVYSFDVIKNSFQHLSAMPIPVDDSVALPYQQRYIYLISGWHNDGNVNLVQVYDTQTNAWSQGSPFPGKPVFGHAGGIVDNTIVVCDGVRIDVHQSKRRSFHAERACYLGHINPKNITKIDWRKLNHPTNSARYRMAAVGMPDKQQIVFIGGSENPYNYNGIGYNGQPSEATDQVWIYDIKDNAWQVNTSPTATMDHRGLLMLNGELVTLGGMGKAQQTLNSINRYFLP
jgi:N-acetylneuraminic acid mutarotase